jgi:hypothetical protein
MLGLIENSPRLRMADRAPERVSRRLDHSDSVATNESDSQKEREFERAIEEWKTFVNNLQL